MLSHEKQPTSPKETCASRLPVSKRPR